MNCNCNSGCLFPASNCATPRYPQSNSCPTCHPHFPAVRKNFTVPPANTDVVIELTDTQSLYTGQGIGIGGTFYQITEITDSLNILAQHNGVGAEPDTTIIALHPTYGCYQYPIIPVGKVSLLDTPNLAGLNQDADTAIGSAVTGYTINALKYGYTGPTTVEVSAEVNFDVDNTPYFIAIALPVEADGDNPNPVFSALLDEGSGFIPAVARLGSGAYASYIIVGPTDLTTYGDASGVRILVSGSYEVAV